MHSVGKTIAVIIVLTTSVSRRKRDHVEVHARQRQQPALLFASHFIFLAIVVDLRPS